MPIVRPPSRVARPSRCTFALLAVASLAFVASDARAQSGGPPVLRVPASTRALAMGDAGSALADVDALFRNPAQLAVARGLAGGASRWGAGATLVSLALALPVAPGGLGLGVQHLTQAAACDPCRAPFDAGEGSLGRDARTAGAASSSVLTLGFGRDLDGVRVGVAAKWVELQVPSARAGAFAVDVGVARRVGWASVAASAQNLGTRLRATDATPARDLLSRATLGVATEGRWVGPFDLSAAAELAYLDGGELVPGAGLEMGYSPIEGYAVAGRVGARRVVGGDVGPLSLGAALSRDRVTLEYAFQPIAARGDLHRVGLRLRP